MGKTGSINWHQIKGVNGQIRLVPQKEGEVKKPGPNQRFKRASIVTKIESRMANAPQQGRRGPKIADPRSKVKALIFSDTILPSPIYVFPREYISNFFCLLKLICLFRGSRLSLQRS